MPPETRRFFCSKANRDQAKLHLSMMSEADLNHLLKIVKREIALRKSSKASSSEADTINPSFGFFQKLKGLSQHLDSRLNKLEPLLKQDWSHLYKCSGTDKKYYVYFHLDPTVKSKKFSSIYGCKSGIPFYVGKGSGMRAYDLKRNQGHGAAIKQLISKGYTKSEICLIAYSGLTEAKALEIEAKLIYLFGSIYQRDRKNSILLNLDIPITPF